MARWLSTLTIYAGCFAFLASAASAQPVTGHTNDDIFDRPTTTIVSVAEGSVGNSSSSIGQVPGSPLFSEFFEFESGVPVQFTLTFEPGSFGGVVVFGIGKSDNVNMGTAEPFNSLLIRTNAELAGTRIDITNLVLGPPPSLGGGGNLVFETASPGTLASSRAIGAMGLDVLKISEVDFAAGFTLQGNLTATFDIQNPPTGDELMGRIYLAGTPDFPDADADTIPDDEDNCPNTANTNQADIDFDGLGDACDNCDVTPNSASLGTCSAGKVGYTCTTDAECNSAPTVGDGVCVLSQADGDQDGAGDVCDNCNVGCTTLNPPSRTCANNQDDDKDNDGVGDLCDNCENTPNGPLLGTCLQGETGLECTSDEECDTEQGGGDGYCGLNQENSDSDPEGDACRDSTIGFSLDDAVASATAPGEATFAMGEVTSPASSHDEVIYGAILDCGSRNITEANVGFLLPSASSVFEEFAGCTTATNNGTCDIPSSTCTAGSIDSACTADADCNNEFNCTGTLWESQGGPLGNTVDKAAITIGPNITDPDDADMNLVPDELVVLKLTGNHTSGAFNNLLCEAYDATNPEHVAGDASNPLNLNRVVLGPITVSNLPDPPNVQISDQGFVALGLTLLVDASSESVPATAIQTSVDSSGSLDILAEMAIEPDPSDRDPATGEFRNLRFLVKMQVLGGDFVTGLAFGLRGPPGIGADQMRFGKCGAPAPDSPGTGLAGTAPDQITVNYCSTSEGSNADLGPDIADSDTTSDIPGSLTVDPNAPLTPFPPNTLMVGLRGTFEEGGDPSINRGDGDDQTIIGVLEFLVPGDPPQATPVIDFQGATLLPGFAGGAIQTDEGGIAPNQVIRVGGGNADSDRDRDGRGDNLDNCPYVDNTDQMNQGGLRLQEGEVDFVGDVCQCGDSTGDGDVADSPGEDDVKDCQLLLAGAEVDDASKARCSITGEEDTTPSIVDLVVLELELKNENSAGTPIDQVCAPARPQPST